MKHIIRILFSLFILGSILLLICSYLENRFDNVTALLALIISIISAWIAFETFNRYKDEIKPILTIRPDFESRYSLFQLRLINNGIKPAYKVKIKWDNEILDLDNEPIAFNKYNKEFDAIVLNGKEEISILVNATHKFFETHKHKSLIFSGNIIYKESDNSLYKKISPFMFSLEHLANKLSYCEEEPKTNFQLQQLPKKLDEIKNAIQNLKE